MSMSAPLPLIPTLPQQLQELPSPTTDVQDFLLSLEIVYVYPLAILDLLLASPEALLQPEVVEISVERLTDHALRFNLNRARLLLAAR